MRAQTEDVALLVVGDPFGATTHCDLLQRAKELGVPVNVVHNASIMNAVGCCGLQLYRFGETVSICFFSPNWRPDSFYDKVVGAPAPRTPWDGLASPRLAAGALAHVCAPPV